MNDQQRVASKLAIGESAAVALGLADRFICRRHRPGWLVLAQESSESGRKFRGSSLIKNVLV